MSAISQVMQRPHAFDPLVTPTSELREGVAVDSAVPSNDRIVGQLHTFGYVVINSGVLDLGAAEDFAAEIMSGLGVQEDPYVPGLYAKGGVYEKSGHNVISSASRASSVGHEAFSGVDGQNWHVDGTLERPGVIRYTLLSALVAGARGGATRLFNAFGAFENLCQKDPAAAGTLVRGDVLTRYASYAPESQGFSSAVFTTDDRLRLINRYSRTPGDVYEAAPGKHRELWRALGLLEMWSLPGSPFEVSLTLEPGQSLLFRNDRLSHGRSPYVDHPDRPRTISRSMYRGMGGDDLAE